MTKVGAFGLFDRIIVDVDHLVEILRDDLRHLAQLVKVVGLIGQHKFVERNRRQIADGHLVWRAILDYLRAQIRAFDRAEILLIRLRVARVLIEHIRKAALALRLNDDAPELARLYLLTIATLVLIPKVAII